MVGTRWGVIPVRLREAYKDLMFLQGVVFMQGYLVEQLEEVHVYRLSICRIELKADAIKPRVLRLASDLIAAMNSSKVMGFSKHSVIMGYSGYTWPCSLWRLPSSMSIGSNL